MPPSVTFEEWTTTRKLASFGTNAGSSVIPFQNWKPFKEAFAPELIERVVESSLIPVGAIIDPFGGSGTTALAAQFLGIKPISVEVNPFLADLICAKLETYDVESLQADFVFIMEAAGSNPDVTIAKKRLPETFLEPGRNGRYIYSQSVGEYILAIAGAIDDLLDTRNARLLRVLLGGVILDVSNIRISGKGRRYRSNWNVAPRATRQDLARRYASHFQSALSDVVRFRSRSCLDHTTIEGDSRQLEGLEESWDAAIFSPPYPNSFDYTDVYNVELWMLGYLSDSAGNRELRSRTLSSHVQIKRPFPEPPDDSVILNQALEQLVAHRSQLWDRHIPEMVGGYFADLLSVMSVVRSGLAPRGSVSMVVGNSQYGDCLVDVANIVAELFAARGWIVREVDPVRSMRRSPQQGGRAELHESLIVLDRID